jgi:hypothetical protein
MFSKPRRGDTTDNSMKVPRTLQAIENTLDQYELFLNGLTDAEFQESPAEGVWSYSEVYSHIIYTDIAGLIALERCLDTNKCSYGPISWQGWLILLTGKFPPRLKAPEKIAAKVQKISMEEAREGLKRLREKLREIAPMANNAPDAQKIKHIRLGLLNARQWLRFIEIHSSHHLRQLSRIESMLSTR